MLLDYFHTADIDLVFLHLQNFNTSLTVKGSWSESYFQRWVNFQLRMFTETSSVNVTVSLPSLRRPSLLTATKKTDCVTEWSLVYIYIKWYKVYSYYTLLHKHNIPLTPLKPHTHFSAAYLQQEEQEVCSLALLLAEALPEWACLPLEKQGEILKDECAMKRSWFSV